MQTDTFYHVTFRTRTKPFLDGRLSIFLASSHPLRVSPIAGRIFLSWAF